MRFAFGIGEGTQVGKKNGKQNYGKKEAYYSQL